jgi:hypothetical protein
MKSPALLAVSAAAALLLTCTLAAQQPAPRVFELNPAAVAKAKAHPSPELLTLAKQEADKALKVPVVPITAKKQTPPSGDKRDYLSMGTYWWPNPDTPNHLPYVRHDGLHNPEAKDILDHENLDHMQKAVHALALGYYLTGDERYAARAVEHLHAWFITPATAMHPSLQYAQYIAGVNEGRGAGILDARMLPQVIDAEGLLASSKDWTATDRATFHKWLADYYLWLTTSKNGHDEDKAPNNHGSWFQEQIIPIALYLGKTDDARARLERVRDERIPSQIDAEGMQKFEMVRTQSFSYSAMNLDALTTTAVLGERVGLDLYQPAKPGAPTILTAVDALMPYDPQHKWPHEQISANRENSLCPALFHVAAHTKAAKYADALKRFQCEPTASTMIEALGN